MAQNQNCLWTFQILFLTDSFPTVRVCALESLVCCLGHVKALPRSSMLAFPEYVLPHLRPLCHDKSDRVRMAMASHIARVRGKRDDDILSQL